MTYVRILMQCTDKQTLTLSCAEGEVDGLLCTQCAVSEGSDGHCILSHCLQTCQGPTCVCCVSHCRCPIQPVNAVHEGPHVWGCWPLPPYFHTGRDRACQPWVERRPWTGYGWEWRAVHNSIRDDCQFLLLDFKNNTLDKQWKIDWVGHAQDIYTIKTFIVMQHIQFLAILALHMHKKLSPSDSPTHGSDGSDLLTLPVPSMQVHTLTTPPGEELIAGQGWQASGLPPTYSFARHTAVHGEKVIELDEWL